MSSLVAIASVVQAAGQTATRPWWGFWWVWIIVALIVLGAIIGFGGVHNDDRRNRRPPAVR